MFFYGVIDKYSDAYILLVLSYTLYRDYVKYIMNKGGISRSRECETILAIETP